MNIFEGIISYRSSRSLVEMHLVRGKEKSTMGSIVYQRACSSLGAPVSHSLPGNAGVEPMESIKLGLTSRMLKYREGQGETTPTTAPRQSLARINVLV